MKNQAPISPGRIGFYIVGAGLLLGIASESVGVLAASAAATGIALNLFLLIRAALQPSDSDRNEPEGWLGKGGRPRSIPLAIVGSVPAGLFDALKIGAIGLLAHWLVHRGT